jgi:UDP-3-O-[3-hydroxymyristoyl] N-acetylglucosamine deacetylase
VTLTLRPAPTDTGVVFVNRNWHAGATLAASVDHLVPTELCTAISGNGFQVKTIEHVLAALAGLSVDNVFVDIDAAEAPVMDGSSAPFVRLIQSAGVKAQNRRRAFLKITRPLEIVDGSRRIRIEPSSTPRITYTIQYDHPMIRTQTYTLIIPRMRLRPRSLKPGPSGSCRKLKRSGPADLAVAAISRTRSSFPKTGS